MLTDENGSDVTYRQNVSANPTNMTQTESGTINPTEANDVIGTIQAAIESGISKQEEKTGLLEALQSLKRAKDRPSFLERTALFLGLATNVPILALHINTWALVLGNRGVRLRRDRVGRRVLAQVLLRDLLQVRAQLRWARVQ